MCEKFKKITQKIGDYKTEIKNIEAKKTAANDAYTNNQVLVKARTEYNNANEYNKTI